MSGEAYWGQAEGAGGCCSAPGTAVDTSSILHTFNLYSCLAGRAERPPTSPMFLSMHWQPRTVDTPCWHTLARARALKRAHRDTHNMHTHAHVRTHARPHTPTHAHKHALLASLTCLHPTGSTLVNCTHIHSMCGSTARTCHHASLYSMQPACPHPTDLPLLPQQCTRAGGRPTKP